MLVFIDESGDPGFKTAAGASPIFVVAMVIFDNAEDAALTQQAIEASDARKANQREFKFNKCSYDVRDKFFSALRHCPFRVRALVVRKALIHSPRLKTDKDKFYEYFVKQMLQFDNGIIKDATIVIDGSGDREFKQNLNTALRRRLGAGVIKHFRFKDSKSDVLVQLADMCAGAIARSYGDKKASTRWRLALGAKLDDVWDFE